MSNLPAQISNPPSPRLLRIKLTLNAPSELRIKAGDEVRPSELLSDRTLARHRLLVQKRALESAAQHLNTQMQLAAESIRHLQSLGLELPPATFAAEQAAIKRAEAEALAVHRAVEIQQQKVSGVRDQVLRDGMQQARQELVPTRRGQKVEHPLTPDTRQPTSPLSHLTPDIRHLLEAHETARLTQAQDRQLLALSEIELHQAKLTTAREARTFAEKQHRVEVIRQLLSARSQQQQAEIERARLTAQLAELELQLAQLTAIRAPFAGTIKRIDWEDMNDEKLTVVVYLAVDSR